MASSTKKRNTVFREWIEELGFKKIATQLGVSTMTVRYWHQGHCSPTWENMRKVHDISKGKVTYFDMFESRVTR